MFKWILDILLPKFCVGCGKEGLYICKDCEVFLSEVDPMISGGPTSPKIKGEVGPLSIVSVWEYEGLMEKLIHKIKFNGCYHIIDELVEKAMAKIDLKLPEDTVITFVPMRKNRERQRGFNQAELIAMALGKFVQHRVLHMLEKIKDNRSQVGLGPKEREENVMGVFAISSDAEFSERFTLKGSDALQKIRHPSLNNVLLVDDVYTTGATVNECKKVLKAAGVKNIWVFTLARKLSI